MLSVSSLLSICRARIVLRILSSSGERPSGSTRALRSTLASAVASASVVGAWAASTAAGGMEERAARGGGLGGQHGGFDLLHDGGLAVRRVLFEGVEAEFDGFGDFFLAEFGADVGGALDDWGIGLVNGLGGFWQ